MLGYMILSNMILCFDILLGYELDFELVQYDIVFQYDVLLYDFELVSPYRPASPGGVARQAGVRRQGEWRGRGASPVGVAQQGWQLRPLQRGRQSCVATISGMTRCVATTSGAALLRHHHQWRGKPGAQKNAQNYEKKAATCVKIL
jgi:hypothetical protein